MYMVVRIYNDNSVLQTTWTSLNEGLSHFNACAESQHVKQAFFCEIKQSIKNGERQCV